MINTEFVSPINKQPEVNKIRKTSILSDKKTEFTSITNLMLTKDPKLKYAIIIVTISLVVCIIISIICSFILKDTRILTFQFDKSIENVFSVNLIMLYIFLIIISFINIFLIYLLIKESDSMVLKLIYSDLHLYFFFTQINLSVPFLIGIYFNHNNLSLISNVSFNIMAVILICFYYKNIKQKRNMTLGAFITIFFYTSVIFTFSIYLSFYNLCEILVLSLSKNENIDIKIIKEILSITSHSFYLIISIVILAYYSDIVYAITLSYLFIGYLFCNIKLENNQFVSTIIILGIEIAAIIVTFTKYGKTLFGIHDDEYIEEFLNVRAEYKMSSVFYANEF